MSDRIPNATLVKFVADANDYLSKLEAEIPASPSVTADDKRRTVKLRKGSDKVVQTVGALVKQNGLDSEALSSDEMLGEQQDALTLAPIEKRLTRMQKRIADLSYVASTSAYDKALQFYTLLQRRALNDGELQVLLEPVAAFFAHRHEKVLEEKPTKLETRAKANLRKAERAMARTKKRAGAGKAASGGNGAQPGNGAPPAPGGNGHTA